MCNNWSVDLILDTPDLYRYANEYTREYTFILSKCHTLHHHSEQ